MVENDVRGKLVDRMNLMAKRHCMHREERRGTRRAVGPHAVAFFYLTRNELGNSEVVAATRLFFDKDDATDTGDLDIILSILNQRAAEYRQGTFDPREHMCNRVERMRDDAELIGVGVTTVYPPPTTANGSATLGMNQPYRALARMVDGTDLSIECAGGFFASAHVRATQTLNLGQVRTREWEWWSSAAHDTELRALLVALGGLLDVAAGHGSEQPEDAEPIAVPPPGRTRQADATAARTRIQLHSKRSR